MLEKIIMKRNLKFTFRANVDTIVAYEFYESRRKNLGERFLDELELLKINRFELHNIHSCS